MKKDVTKLEKAERWYQESFVIRRETGRVAPINIEKKERKGRLDCNIQSTGGSGGGGPE